MAFIDNLAYGLFSISFAGFLLLYTALSMFLAYKRKQRNLTEYLKGACIPIAIIGIYLLITGIWGQFVWPLPGSYNILFYDPLVSFGILLIAFSMAIKYDVKLEYVGFLGLLIGIMAIVYGIEGYNIGLTSAPIALLLMYLFYGLSGIFSYPISLIADRLPGSRSNNTWLIILAIFCLLLFLASALSSYIGILAIPQHLLSAP